MKNKAFWIVLLGLFSCMSMHAQVSFGEAKKFNDGWLFSLSDDSLSASVSYDDSKWRQLDLPHDWSIEGQLSPSLASCTGYLPGGIGWYRKHFQLTDEAARHYIYFEGVYNRSEVYLNGHLLGKRPNGYISFMYDMSPYLKEGDNVLAVRVDHSRYADSRWYTGSGIYRDVWMVAAPEIHLAQWGLGWHATSITDKQAVVSVELEVEKHVKAEGKLEVKAALYDADGKLVAAHVDLDRITERRNLHDLERSALDEPQVHKVTAKRTLTVKLDDGRALAHLNVTQRLHPLVPLSVFMKCCGLTDGHDVHGNLGIDAKACAQHLDYDIGATRDHHVDFVALDKAEVLEVVLHVLIALYTRHAHGFARFYHRKRHGRHLRSARHEWLLTSVRPQHRRDKS